MCWLRYFHLCYQPRQIPFYILEIEFRLKLSVMNLSTYESFLGLWYSIFYIFITYVRMLKFAIIPLELQTNTVCRYIRNSYNTYFYVSCHKKRFHAYLASNQKFLHQIAKFLKQFWSENHIIQVATSSLHLKRELEIPHTSQTLFSNCTSHETCCSVINSPRIKQGYICIQYFPKGSRTSSICNAQ